MARHLRICQLLVSLTLTLARKDDIGLPPCPSNLEYFPQDLPMHCRMPRDSERLRERDFPQIPTLPPDALYNYFQSPSPDKQAPPLPIQIPPFPGMPAMPGPMPPGMMPPMPPGMGPPQPMPPGMAPGMPVPMPMPMPMPGAPPHKLPVIVMPFYSPERGSFTKPPHIKRRPRRPPHKRRPHHRDSSDTDTSSQESQDTSNSDESSDSEWWRGHKKKRGHKKYGISRRFNRHHNMRKKKKKSELLTPLLQYVTKDGYVIFEKKISKNEAKDWLGPKEEDNVKEEEKYFKKELEVAEEQEPKVEAEKESEEVDLEENQKIKERDGKEKHREINVIEEFTQTDRPYKRPFRQRNHNLPLRQAPQS